jgi:hypothetical protein
VARRPAGRGHRPGIDGGQQRDAVRVAVDRPALIGERRATRRDPGLRQPAGQLVDVFGGSAGGGRRVPIACLRVDLVGDAPDRLGEGLAIDRLGARDQPIEAGLEAVGRQDRQVCQERREQRRPRPVEGQDD